MGTMCSCGSGQLLGASLWPSNALTFIAASIALTVFEFSLSALSVANLNRPRSAARRGARGGCRPSGTSALRRREASVSS